MGRRPTSTEEYHQNGCENHPIHGTGALTSQMIGRASPVGVTGHLWGSDAEFSPGGIVLRMRVASRPAGLFEADVNRIECIDVKEELFEALVKERGSARSQFGD